MKKLHIGIIGNDFTDRITIREMIEFAVAHFSHYDTESGSYILTFLLNDNLDISEIVKTYALANGHEYVIVPTFQDILVDADLLVVFWDGKSKILRKAINVAFESGHPVYIYDHIKMRFEVRESLM